MLDMSKAISRKRCLTRPREQLIIGNHISKIQWYHFGPSKVTPDKGFGPPIWGTVHIYEVNGARKLKSDAQVAIDKNSDTMQKLFP